jgi:hypothetical protein
MYWQRDRHGKNEHFEAILCQTQLKATLPSQSYSINSVLPA